MVQESCSKFPTAYHFTLLTVHVEVEVLSNVSFSIGRALYCPKHEIHKAITALLVQRYVAWVGFISSDLMSCSFFAIRIWKCQ